MRAVAVAVVLATIVPASALAGSDSSLRCAGGLVALGDATVDLLGKCGAPTLREARADEVWVSARATDAAVKRTVLVTVERWTYDFGPQRFLMFVTVEGGKVVAIARGGYGYARSDPAAVPLRRATCEPSAIRAGDAKLDLLARCGEPTVVDTRPASEVRVITDTAEGVAAGRRKAVELEVWTYDFGPQVLMRFAYLENGVVTRVETGSHGYAR